jgi:hypothetical protein
LIFGKLMGKVRDDRIDGQKAKKLKKKSQSGEKTKMGLGKKTDEPGVFDGQRRGYWDGEGAEFPSSQQPGGQTM